MQILIVGRDAAALDGLEAGLRRLGHTALRARDGREALERLRQDDLHLVIADWDLPGSSGPEFCRSVREEELSGYVYLVILSSRNDPASRRAALRAGADDFLSKPLEAEELPVCLATADRILALETRDVALFALAKLAESRDPETGRHIERVQAYARLLARNLSTQAKLLHGVDGEYIRLLHMTSPLHDLGKVAIPDAILLKPGKLTEAEFEVMKTHAAQGAQTLDAALTRFPNARFLWMARDIAATHHEKFDGSGYPNRLAGEQIPFCGRLVALADVYDALTSRRVYKEPMNHRLARQLIIAQRERHFDPDVVDAFLQAEPQFAAVAMQMQDEPHPLRVTPQFVALPPDDAVTGGGCGILVVEDSPMMLKKLVEIASASGRTVYSAADAAEALKLFVEHRPGVVVSDWEIPGDSGVDLCRQIRGQSIGRHAHFIMLTSHSDHEAILQAYNAGVDDFVAKPFDPDELLARIHAGERIHQLHEDLTRKTSEQQSLNSELAAMNVKLDRLAVTDDLTGLFNRRYAVARLEEHWALAERYNQPVTLGMVDLDKFKNVNDTYGHPAGDVVLRQVARMLRQTLRSTDIVCRIGGEEFMILFAAQTVEEAAISAERCRRAVASQSIRAAGVAISVTISIGLAGRTTEMAEYSDLMHAADRMLYDAKRNGRNRVEVAGRAEEGGADNLNTVFRYVAESAGPLRRAALRAGAGLNRASVLSRCGGDERFADAVTEQFRTEAPLCAERIAAALKSADAQSLRCAAQKLGSLAAYVSADRVTDYSRRVEHLAETNGLLEAGALLPRLKREIDGIVVTLEANAGAIMAICA